MSVYGSKLYGSFTYGVGATSDISVYPFTTQSLDYGTIKLSWIYPSASADFTTFLVLRNAMGFPVTADGGDLILKTDKTTLTTAGPGSTSLLGLEGTLTDTGSFYDPITGSATPTYTATVTGSTDNSVYVNIITANTDIKVGQRVTYTPTVYLTGPNSGSGIIGNTTVTAISVDGKTLTLSKAATIPDGTVLTFSPTFLTPGKSYYYSAFVFVGGSWQRVGTAIGTSIKDYNTAEVVYGLLPQVYRTGIPSSSSTSVNRNNDLYNLLRVIGVQYDLIKTKVENAKNRYDVTNLDGRLLPAMMDQMGFSYESGLGIQQSRRLLNNFDYIALNKGTKQGLRRFVNSFTGYSATLAPVKNLFLTLDCSSFEAGTGFWKSSRASASLSVTTPTLEGGSPQPYSVSASPDGYANSQLGYMKVTALTTTSASNPIELTYGTSMDNAATGSTKTVVIPVQTPNGSTIIKVATATPHGFTAGKTLVISGVTPSGYNGIWTTQPGTTGSILVLNIGSNPGKITAAGSANILSIKSGSNNSESGYQYVSLTTGDIEHGLSVGQHVVVSCVSPATSGGLPAINGIWKVTDVPNTTTFTYRNPNLVEDISSQIASIGTSSSVSVYDPKTCGIPVTAGLAYSASIHSIGLEVARSWKMGIRWYDKYGTYLSEDVGNSQNCNRTTWTRISVTNKIAPAYAAYAVPYVQNVNTVSDTTSHYFDAAQFEQSTAVTTYADARRVDVYLNAARVNEIINPGFELSTTNWYTTGTSAFALDATNVYPNSSTGLGIAISTNSAKLTANSGVTTLENSLDLTGVSSSGTTFTVSSTANVRVGQLITKVSGTGTLAVGATTVASVLSSTQFTVTVAPTVALVGARITLAGTQVTPGIPYAVSSYIKGAGTNTATISGLWIDSTGSALQTDTSSAVTLSSSFTRVSFAPGNDVEMIAPAGAAMAIITFSITGASGNVYYVDSVLFEKGSSVNAYFDGGTGYNNLDDLTWEQNAAYLRGTASTGRSLYYPNKILTRSRLNAALPDYLPIGTRWATVTGITIT